MHIKGHNARNRCFMKTTAPLLLLFWSLPAWFAVQAQSNLSFNHGDRVVFLGNTFTERAQRHSHIEAAMALGLADKELVFRNIGWSGDNVYGESRSYFGNRDQGYRTLLAHVDLAKPDVLIVHYGANAAFGGPSAIPEFIKQYGKLIDDLAKRTKRIMLVAPPPLESHPSIIKDPAPHNAVLAQFRDAIKTLAEEKDLAFTDLYQRCIDLTADGSRLTENGMHFADVGYRKLGSALLRTELKDTPAYRKFCGQIRAKNQLFFHQYRPQNETYLRLFRKHEQGQNAKELDEFPAHIEVLDAEIHRAAKVLVRETAK